MLTIGSLTIAGPILFSKPEARHFSPESRRLMTSLTGPRRTLLLCQTARRVAPCATERYPTFPARVLLFSVDSVRQLDRRQVLHGRPS